MALLEGIEGLTAIENPQSMVSEGRFQVPSEVDRRKWSCRWVLDGPSVISAQSPEIIISAGQQAQGWAVFRADPKADPVKRTIGKNTYVLMVRPKALQQAVNLLHARESRLLVNRELVGETSAVNAGDPGILSNADLKTQLKLEEGDEESTLLPVPSFKDITRAGELNTQV